MIVPVTVNVAVSCVPPVGVTKPDILPVAVSGWPSYSLLAVPVVIVSVAGVTVSVPSVLVLLLYWSLCATV